MARSLSIGSEDRVTISTLVDSNILIDILGSGTSSASSLRALAGVLNEGPVVVNAIVWAELAYHADSEGKLFEELSWLRLRREDLPFAAAYPAGRAHRLYRERGGARERTLPDFLIGAHALVSGHRLLTRDASRYRAYFPDLEIIAPEDRP